MVTTRTLLAGVLFAACIDLTACDPARPSDSIAAQNPFATAERVDPAESTWSGRVLERVNAGSYVYLRVERQGAPESWVVTAEAIATDAERVQVRVLRRVEHFESKRLGRRFSPLFFGIVGKDKT